MLGEWEVTPLLGTLRAKGIERRLTPRAVDVLLLLAATPRDVVAKDELLEKAWAGRAMSDAPLAKVIAELRRELGDDSQAPRFIETIPKRGYRLLLEPKYGDAAADSSRSRVAPRWGAVAVLFVATLVFAALAWRFADRAATPPWQAAASQVAVLPFDVIDTGPALESFAAGMHEQIIARLQREPDLPVLPRRSTLAYLGTTRGLPEIAAELDVPLVVDGSVRLDGNRLFVNAELVFAETNTSIWSRDFEGDLSVASVFAIQQQIAANIAAFMQTGLAAPAGALSADNNVAVLPTASYVAYEAFLLGKYHYRRQLPGDIELSIHHLEQAVAADPQFAAAWDWLAYAYNHAATSLSTMAADDAYGKGRAAALRALDIDPELHTARAILGYIRAVYEWDWAGAEADLRQAVAGDPYDTGTVWSLAHVLSMREQHDEAIDLVRELAIAAPENGRLAREVANRLVDARRFDDALVWVDRAAENGDEPAFVQALRAVVLFGLGRYDDALAESERAAKASGDTVYALGQQATVHAALGNVADVERLLAAITAKHVDESRNDPVTIAAIHAASGRHAAALDYLEAAAERHDRAVLSVHLVPLFDDVLATERGQALAGRLDLPQKHHK